MRPRSASRRRESFWPKRAASQRRFSAGPSAELACSVPRVTAIELEAPDRRPITIGVFASIRALLSESETEAPTMSRALRMLGETLFVTETVPETMRTAFAEAPTTPLDQYADSFQFPVPLVQAALVDAL